MTDNLDPDGNPYLCSYCTRDAVAVGDGQDGDFYCRTHIGHAPGTTSAI